MAHETIPVHQNGSFEVSPLSQRKLPLVPVSSSIQPSVPPRDLADMIATPGLHLQWMTDIAGLEMFCLLTNRDLHYALKISHSLARNTTSLFTTLLQTLIF